MDSSRFDAFSRRLAAPGSRRGLLKAFGGLFAGAVVSTVLADDADAVSCKSFQQSCTNGSQCCSGTCNDAKHPDRTRRSRCACETGQTDCNGSCRDLSQDTRNCGGCGVTCNFAESCIDGICLCLTIECLI